MSDQLPEGSKLSVIKTEGIQAGKFPLYNLMGLSGSDVLMLVDLLKAYISEHPNRGVILAEKIMAVLKPISEEM